jgi:chemotaxis regulatin CheY-phosphate phosphatase CheZ
MTQQPPASVVAQAKETLQLVLNETEHAAETIIAAVNALHSSISGEDSAARAQLDVILAACSFQDICGQRIRNVLKQLDTLGNAAATQAKPASADDPASLLNGPQAAGTALTQEEIDRMLNE